MEEKPDANFLPEHLNDGDGSLVEQQEELWCVPDLSHSPPKRQKRTTVAEKIMRKKYDTTEEGGSEQQNQKYYPRDNKPKNGRDRKKDIEHHHHHGETSGRRDKGPGRIPDRWLQYKVAIGQPIENTRFLAFKTPLRPLFFNSKEFKGKQEQRFEVETVINHVNSLKKSLGLVIDLTNTDRYYDSKLWDNHNVRYLKIRCPGHEVNGDDEFYQRFCREVKKFISQSEQSENEDKLIGVHCTHGLNRTGYLICRFLIEEHNWTTDKAIESFHQARGYPMERMAYIESLREAERRLFQLNV